MQSSFISYIHSYPRMFICCQPSTVAGRTDAKDPDCRENDPIEITNQSSTNTPIGSMVLLYMVTWIPSIYPNVSIYTIHIYIYYIPYMDHHGSYGTWEPLLQLPGSHGPTVLRSTSVFAPAFGRAAGHPWQTTNGASTGGTASIRIRWHV